MIYSCFLTPWETAIAEKTETELFIDSNGITYILKTYADAARKEHPSLIPDVISCHSMRHSKAMHMHQSGVELIYIRDILGHVSIQTTDIYARTDTKAKREALEKAYTPMTDGSVNITAEWQDNPDLLEWLHS